MFMYKYLHQGLKSFKPATSDLIFFITQQGFCPALRKQTPNIRLCPASGKGTIPALYCALSQSKEIGEWQLSKAQPGPPGN